MTPRQAVVAEALTWIGTPFQMNQCVKGAGVDCGRLLVAVYSAAGAMPSYAPKRYSPQWHLHRSAEDYVADISKFAREIEGPPQPGDIAMFHVARVYAHAGIVIQWPERVIHAPGPRCKVGFGDASRDALLLLGRRQFPPRFFSPFEVTPSPS